MSEIATILIKGANEPGMNMIKRIQFWLTASIALCAVSATAQDDTTRVLFIGNSHTYTHNVPGLFAGMAQAGGHPTLTEMSAPGGYTLQQHTTYQPTLDKIALGIWNYVSLQEQSIYPVIEYYRWSSFYPSARWLDSMITALGQETILYMTWGRPNGGQWSIGGHYTIYFNDFFHMQDSISASFQLLADELDAPLIPAGNAWARARRADSALSLWGPDSLHATLAGAYLAACTFYAVLFEESPVGLNFYGGLAPEVALFLQEMADQTVSSIADESPRTPDSFALHQNYPNPFNARTTLAFDLPQSGNISLTIYNVLGECVRTPASGLFDAGRHSIIWDGHDEGGEAVRSGIYFSTLRQGEKSQSIRLVYLK